MMIRYWLTLLSCLFLSNLIGQTETLTTFNGYGFIALVDSTTTNGGHYTLTFLFNDDSGTYATTDAAIGDYIWDVNCNRYSIVFINSTSPFLEVEVLRQNSNGQPPTEGGGNALIYRPTTNYGYFPSITKLNENLKNCVELHFVAELDSDIYAASQSGSGNAELSSISTLADTTTFLLPYTGALLLVEDIDVYYYYTGSLWSPFTTGETFDHSNLTLNENWLLDFSTFFNTWDMTNATLDNIIHPVLSPDGRTQGWYVDDTGNLSWLTNNILGTDYQSMIRKNLIGQIYVGNLLDTTIIQGDKIFMDISNSVVDNSLLEFIAIDPISKEIKRREIASIVGGNSNFDWNMPISQNAYSATVKMFSLTANLTSSFTLVDPDNTVLDHGDIQVFCNDSDSGIISITRPSDYTIESDTTLTINVGECYWLQVDSINNEFKVIATAGLEPIVNNAEFAGSTLIPFSDTITFDDFYSHTLRTLDGPTTYTVDTTDMKYEITTVVAIQGNNQPLFLDWTYFDSLQQYGFRSGDTLSGLHYGYITSSHYGGAKIAFPTATAGGGTIGIADATPIPLNDTLFVQENSSNNSLDVLANDSFGDDGPGTTALTITVSPLNGTASVADNSTSTDPTDDSILYSPDNGHIGDDVIGYQICDNDGDCAQAFVLVTTVADGLPTAANDAYTISENTATNLSVLDNDSFGTDGASSSAITITTNGTNGTATIDDNGTATDPTDDTIDFAPNASYTGPDSFVYEICDSDGDCDQGTVTITVEATSFSMSSLGTQTFELDKRFNVVVNDTITTWTSTVDALDFVENEIASRQPTVAAGGELQFDSDDWMVMGNSRTVDIDATNDGVAITWVIQVNDNTGSVIFSNSATGTDRLVHKDSLKTDFNAQAVFNSSGPGQNVAVVTLSIPSTANGGAATLYVDGVPVATDSSVNAGGRVGQYDQFGRIDTEFDNYFMNSTIWYFGVNEFVGTAALTDAQASQINTHLRTILNL